MQDATEPFNDVGHSADAKEMAREYAVGRLKTTGEKVRGRDPGNRRTQGRGIDLRMGMIGRISNTVLQS